MSVKNPGCQEDNDDGDENRQRDQDFAHWLPPLQSPRCVAVPEIHRWCLETRPQNKL
jgi:hypothetical protein